MPKLFKTDPVSGHHIPTDITEGEYSADDINQRTTTRALQMAQAIVKQAQAEGWNSPAARAEMTGETVTVSPKWKP